MKLHVMLVDVNHEKLEDSEIIHTLVNGILLIIFTLFIFGLQYRLNDYLSGM